MLWSGCASCERMVSASSPMRKKITSAVPTVSRPMRLWSVLLSQPVRPPCAAVGPGRVSTTLTGQARSPPRPRGFASGRSSCGRSSYGRFSYDSALMRAAPRRELLRGDRLEQELHLVVELAAVHRAAADPLAGLGHVQGEVVDVVREGLDLVLQVRDPELVHHVLRGERDVDV